MMDKPRIDAESIRSALLRISADLRSKTVAMRPDREKKNQVFLPAADHVDNALVCMQAPGINTEGAVSEIKDALVLLGTHDELQSILDDLILVSDGKATLQY